MPQTDDKPHTTVARLWEMTPEETAKHQQDAWDKARWDEAARMRLSRAKGFAEGFIKVFVKDYVEGRTGDFEQLAVEAKARAMPALARAMLRKGFRKNNIAHCTDFSIDEIEKLEKALSPNRQQIQSPFGTAVSRLMEMSADEVLRRQKSAWDRARRDEEARNRLNRAEGSAEGEAKKSAEIAANLRKKGLPVTMIAEATGLGPEEIAALPEA